MAEIIPLQPDLGNASVGNEKTNNRLLFGLVQGK